MRLEYHP
jgi:hypothetical protein